MTIISCLENIEGGEDTKVIFNYSTEHNEELI